MRQGSIMPRRSSIRDLASAVAELRDELRICRRENRDLRRENEILREAAEPLVHIAPARERFAFIHARRERFSIRLMCRVLVIDRCNYHWWVRAEAKRREREYDNRRLAELIFEVHTVHPAYGVPRVTRELQAQGIPVGRRRVAGSMRKHEIAGITRRRRRSPTKPDKAAAAVPDLIRRQFTAPMPGLKLIGDISCFPTSEAGYISRRS